MGAQLITLHYPERTDAARLLLGTNLSTKAQKSLKVRFTIDQMHLKVSG